MQRFPQATQKIFSNSGGLSETVSPILQVSKCSPLCLPRTHKKTGRQCRGAGAAITVVTLSASYIRREQITIQGTTGTYLTPGCFTVMSQQDRVSFLSFISSYTAAHNSLVMDMKETSSDCYQLFCSCATSVFLSPLALWPRTKAHNLIQPLPLRSQLDQLS